MKNKKGIAIVVVLFFAFAIAIILFFMAQSNTNLAFQNKQTLYQMQAYYLAHSGMQHAKLQLKLLPKETYEYFYKGGAGNPFEYIDSSAHAPLAMGAEYKDVHKNYDLFAGNAPDDGVPYAGNYRVVSCELLGSHDSMKMVQDGYKLEVKAEIDSGGKGKQFSDSLTEEVYVARFTGAVD
ncbi:MAG: hypothetical protein ACQETH_03705 [Candidatus Rifleibacteriota bacterium]